MSRRIDISSVMRRSSHTVGTSAERIEVDVEVEVWASLARVLLTPSEFLYVE